MKRKLIALIFMISGMTALTDKIASARRHSLIL
jgi:hypothetical protein